MNSGIRPPCWHAWLPLELLHLLYMPLIRIILSWGLWGPALAGRAHAECWSEGHVWRWRLPGAPVLHIGMFCSPNLPGPSAQSPISPDRMNAGRAAEPMPDFSGREVWSSFPGHASHSATWSMGSYIPRVEFVYELWMHVPNTSRLHNKRTFNRSLNAWNLLFSQVPCLLLFFPCLPLTLTWAEVRNVAVRVVKPDPPLCWGSLLGCWSRRPRGMEDIISVASVSSSLPALLWPLSLASCAYSEGPSYCSWGWSFYNGIGKCNVPAITSAIHVLLGC